MEKITVIGGGNGGFAAAADLTLRNNQVMLYEVPQFADGLKEVIERGGIDLEAFPGNGLESGFAKLHKITTDIKEAVDESDILLVILPSYALNTIVSLLVPHLRDGQIVALCPGNFGGVLYFYHQLKQSSNPAKVWLADFACMMYATRKKTPCSVWVRRYKHNLGAAIIPEEGSEEAFARLQGIYPYIKKYSNPIATAMSSINTTLHTSLMLLNAANIDNEEERHFYRECTTKPSLDNLMDALDAERLQLNQIDGFSIPAIADFLRSWYSYQGATGETVGELMRSAPHYAYSMMPKTMNYRYVTEDVPYGLIPCAAFLEQMGYSHTVHTALINILCAVCDKDFYKEARTLEEMGIAGMDGARVIKYMKTGR